MMAGCVALLLPAAVALAGDEDISPNAYQEFDPVTGYMITVDPDAEDRKDHDRAAAEATGVSGGAPEAEPLVAAWVYWVVAAGAGALLILWILGRAQKSSPLRGGLPD